MAPRGMVGFAIFITTSTVFFMVYLHNRHTPSTTPVVRAEDAGDEHSMFATMQDSHIGTGSRAADGKETRRLEPAGRICCKALTAQCLSCAAGVRVVEYCLLFSDTPGCPAVTPGQSAEQIVIKSTLATSSEQSIKASSSTHTAAAAAAAPADAALDSAELSGRPPPSVCVEAKEALAAASKDVGLRLAFARASAPFQALRAAVCDRTLPDGCDLNAEFRSVDLVLPDCGVDPNTKRSRCVPMFVHGGETRNSWFGQGHPGARESCTFTSLLFEPTPSSLNSVLQMSVYLTNGHWRTQCIDDERTKKVMRSRWLLSTAQSCWGNNFPIHFLSEAECIRNAADARPSDHKDGIKGPNCLGPKCITKVPLSKAPLPGVAQLSASLHGVLPPPPYLVYARNAILSTMVRTSTESYVVGCAPYWQAMGGPKNAGHTWIQFPPREGFEARQKVAHILEVCRGSGPQCPIPRHRKAVFLTQVFSGE